MQLGFMSILPHPVTEYTTAGKSKTNFQSVWTQLNQDVMQLFDDGGAFHLLVNMMLNEPDVFWLVSNTTKLSFEQGFTLMCSKILTGIGARNDLIERKVCGKKVPVSVLSESHYVTSLQGMFIVSEVFIHLLGKRSGRLNNMRSFWNSI